MIQRQQLWTPLRQQQQRWRWSCDCKCPIEVCGQCPIAPAQYQFSVSGIVPDPNPLNGCPYCPNYNGDWVLTHTSLIPDLFAPSICRWIAQTDDVICYTSGLDRMAWRLDLPAPASFGEAFLQIGGTIGAGYWYCLDFDCFAGGLFTKATDPVGAPGNQCHNWPDTITVTAV